MASPTNHLTLAVAGSGKTRGIVTACASSSDNARILVLTYTVANQRELETRLAPIMSTHAGLEVSGWFSFLIGHFVRPFLPHLYKSQRVRGFAFDSEAPDWAKNEDCQRYFSSIDEVRRVHLPQLACRVEAASSGAGIRRLRRVFDRIYIDEVQDLCGYDLEILKLLMDSGIPLEMVGDVRQAVLATNEREQKNKKYMYLGIWDWFQEQKKKGRLDIEQQTTTWRCRPEIAAFADSLFAPERGFDPTQSVNQRVTSHDGVYLVRSSDIRTYVAQFAPLLMRWDKRSRKDLDDLHPMNYRIAKGLEAEHALIIPTPKITAFLRNGTPLDDSIASRFYVAVTRAKQSVAIVLDDGTGCSLPVWVPENRPDTRAILPVAASGGSG